MAQANKVQIRNIAINEFAIVALNEKLEGGTNFNFDVNFAYSVNVENSLVNVLTSVTISGADKSKVHARLQTVCGFQINEPEFAKQDAEGKVTIGDALAQDLNTVALSTTRGVLFTQLKGTYLHNAVLPIINMNAMAKKN